MENEVIPYVDAKKLFVKRKIDTHLSGSAVASVAQAAFAFHFSDDDSLAFQTYYQTITGNREHFLSSRTFFRDFKQMYSLQGIDGAHLDNLESAKKMIIRMIDDGKLTELFFTHFADVVIQHGKGTVNKTLGSFFAKLIHTFRPAEYCALDNPIKQFFGLGTESFFIAFIVISQAYKEWAFDKKEQMHTIRNELERNEIGRTFSTNMTDLKLLDLIFWYQANKA